MRKPNILWIMTDEQRTDSLGCYGSRWGRTPNLDSLGEQGVVFSSAITPAPVCVPARTALLTGRYPSDTGVWWNHQPIERLAYLTAAFAQAGYQTASFGKQHYGGRNPAFEHEENLVLTDRVDYFAYDHRFPIEAYDVVQYPPQPYPWILGGRFPGQPEDTMEFRVVERAIQWLEERDHGLPFLLRVSFNGPHTPVVVPDPYAPALEHAELDQPKWPQTPTEGEPRWIRHGLRQFSDAGRLTFDQLGRAGQYYYAYVSFIDSQCGRLLTYLNRQGLTQDTVIVYTSDHGTHLGDYRLVQKQTFYDCVVNVPLIMTYPGHFRSGIRIQTPVETRSLLPTLLDLVGVAYDGDAESLLACLRSGQEPSSSPVFSEFTLGSFGLMPDDPLIMVRYRNWKLSLCMKAEDTDGMLVDLSVDPEESRNLWNDPRYSAVQSELGRIIEEHLASPRKIT